MAETPQEKIYVASSASLYDKPLYEEYRKQLTQLYPRALFVWAKDAYRDTQDWKTQWPRYCRHATILIFLTDEGWIGRGVHTEIEDMLKAGKPVFYFHQGQFLTVTSLHADASVHFGKVTDSWKMYCQVTIGSERAAPERVPVRNSTSASRKQQKQSWKEEQRKRENAKLNKHGFTWKKLFNPERWQLTYEDGYPVSREEALQRCEDIEVAESEAAMSRCPQLSWNGVFSEAVMEHPAIDSMYQEGDSYVIFDPDTKVEAIPEKPEWKRYTLTDGSVFIFDGNYLESEQEKADSETRVFTK